MFETGIQIDTFQKRIVFVEMMENSSWSYLELFHLKLQVKVRRTVFVTVTVTQRKLLTLFAIYKGFVYK